MPEGPKPLSLLQCNPSDGPRYYWNEDKPRLKYASVTSILSATQSKETKAALKHWRNKIRGEGGDPKQTLIEASRRGAAVHNWIEPWLLRRHPSVPVEIHPWCQRIQESPIWGFIDYVICTEMKVCSDQGLIPFAGTFDALFKIGDETVLFDLKTKGEGKKQPSKVICNEALCQMQAYRLCLKENHSIDVDRLIALYVFPDQPSIPVFASGDDLLYHEKHWQKRLQQYANQQS